jgi:predicted metal-binding membrane protein
MLVLFAAGVMSVTWMLVVTGLVFAEKVLPGGARLSRGIGLALAVLAIWIAVSPATVPGLTAPAAAGGPQGGPPMDMPMR